MSVLFVGVYDVEYTNICVCCRYVAESLDKVVRGTL